MRPSEQTPPTGPIIGVFDSGFGGLTVLRELLALLPAARFLYLGDSARLPYGSKSRATIARYALSSVQFLLDHGAQVLVIACNTATALALPEILAAAGPIPVVGVIEPGAHAVRASAPPGRNPHVLILATPATVRSHAYLHAMHRLGLPATEKACPLLVPLVEEGWVDHPVTAEVLRIYLTEALFEAPAAEALVLGCTHYPLLAPAIERTLLALDHPMLLIDSAQATAQAVAHTVTNTHPALSTLQPGASTSHPSCEFFATDSIEKFAQLGFRFLGRPVGPVHLVDLGG